MFNRLGSELENDYALWHGLPQLANHATVGTLEIAGSRDAGVLLISVQKVTVRASLESEDWRGVCSSSTRKCLSCLEFLLVSRSAAEGLFAWSISAASTRFRCSL